MAAFDICYEWMIDNEDPARACAIVSDDPPGSHAISGINSHYFPEDYAKIAALPRAERAPAIKAFYHDHFWNGWFGQLASDEVAKRVFDSAVNEGSGTAVKTLQTAINDVTGLGIGVDGGWGPATLQGANNCDPDMLASAFRTARSNHYRNIVRTNPAKGQFLPEWLKRAGK